jgi:membrane associated rhomboid family serine protease
VQRRAPNGTPVAGVLIAVNLAISLLDAVRSFDSIQAIDGLSDIQRRMVIAQQFLDNGEWWRLVTAGFVHFGMLHVAMNMLLLFQLGRMLEPALGSVKFALLYAASLLGGSAGAVLVSPDALTGGASGAVFGLMAAAVVGLRGRGGNPFATGLGATFAVNIALTLAIPGISIGGHFGGAIAGAAAGIVLLAPARRQPPQWAQVAVPVLVGAACVLLALSR